MTRCNRCAALRSLWLLVALVALAACSARVTAPPEPPRAVRRGDEAFRFKEYDAAIAAYRSYVDETEEGDYVPRVLYKIALADYRMGRYDETLKTLADLEHRYRGAHWVQVDALRGDAEHALHNDMAALQAWDAGWKIGSKNDQQKLRERIVAVARGLNDVDLARARRMATQDDVGNLLDKQIALRQPPALNEAMPGSEGEERASAHAAAGAPAEPEEMSEAEREAAEPEVAEPLVIEPPVVEPPIAKPPLAEPRVHKAPAAQSAAAEPEEVAPPAEEPPFIEAPSDELKVSGATRIGCLLPLSGPSREYGERSLRGLRLVFGNNNHLVVKDTAGDPATALSAWNELARDRDVVVVIGPLRSEDAAAVAPRAEQMHVPVLLLSQRDGLTGHYVLQVGMTRSRLVGTLLDYAMDKMRLRRFGVLYPEDPYGKEFLSSFRAAVERRGGTVIGTSGYSPETHALAVGTVRKWRDAQHVQAVFLPDTATTAAGLARYLQSEMPDVTLLGVHGWESLADHEDGNLSGVLFTDGFYASSTRTATHEFVERFQQAYGGEMPGTLEAQAYDAALLAKDALDAGAKSRAEVLRDLQLLGSVDGATGQLHVTPDGIQRTLFLLQVYDGKLQEIGSAG